MVGGRSNGPAHGISAPKGGGVLCGLGETFAPDLHTGTGRGNTQQTTAARAAKTR
jgi:hypothetical protein